MKRSEFIRMLVGAGFLSAIPSAFSRGARDFHMHQLDSMEAVEKALPLDGTGKVSSSQRMIVRDRFIYHANGTGRRIALSYDDGPTYGVTDKILNELAKRDQKATFFMIGRKVKRNAGLVKEVHAAGHEIGNHTYTHPFLTKLSHDQVREEIKRTQEDIADVIGEKPKWFRPPYGDFNKSLASIPESMGLGIVFWSLDTKDYMQPGAEVIAQRVIKNVVPGSIILLHDLTHQSMEATPKFLDYFKDQSYKLVTMRDILGEPKL